MPLKAQGTVLSVKESSLWTLLTVATFYAYKNLDFTFQKSIEKIKRRFNHEAVLDLGKKTKQNDGAEDVDT